MQATAKELLEQWYSVQADGVFAAKQLRCGIHGLRQTHHTFLDAGIVNRL
jgi:hypothetical protein